MGNHVCDNTKLVIQVTGHGHDNPKKQPQQLMFYKDDYKTPLDDVKAQESTTQLQEDKYPSNYECPSILFEYPECDVKDTQLAIKIPKETGGEIILPLLDKVEGGTTDKDNNKLYKSHRIWSIVPMTKISSPTELRQQHFNYSREEYVGAAPTYALVREGYIYVIVNGKLWRELKIVQEDEKTYFQDIDLAKDREKQGIREAVGKKIDDIWIPAAFPSQQINVQIAYSEEQWPYERINYLEKEQRAREFRCNNIASDTTVQKTVVNSFNFYHVADKKRPFQLTNLSAIRARNFEDELMLDNPSGYLRSLAQNYLKDVLEINHNTFSQTTEKKAYEDSFTREQELTRLTNYHFETGAWLSIVYQRDSENNEDIKAIADFWPTADKYTTYQRGRLEEEFDINDPQQKVTNVLENYQKRYILGILVNDDTYAIHHYTSRISNGATLLQKMEGIAAKRPAHYLASLVNSQRKYFTNINDALRSVDRTVRQNFSYSLAEVERLGVVRLIKQSQNLLYRTLVQPTTHEAIADLLSNHNPVDYAGHMLFVLMALNTVATPAHSYDPLTTELQTKLTEGQQFIKELSNGNMGYQKLTAMLQTAKVDDEVLKNLEEYFTSSTEPTDNLGDGAFRLTVLKELNNQLKQTKIPEAQSYNGKNIAEFIDKIERNPSKDEYAQRVASSAYPGAVISTLKGISSSLMTIASNLQQLYISIEQADLHYNQIIHANAPSGAVSAEYPFAKDLQTTEKFQRYHAHMYHNIREVMPEIFKDFRFVPLERLLLRTGYVVAVDDAIKQISELNKGMGGAYPRVQYNTTVRMVEIKPGSQLEALCKEFDSQIKSPRWEAAYKVATEQIWHEKLVPQYSSRGQQWLVDNKERLLSYQSNQELITHRMVTNVLVEDIANNKVVDYGTGTTKDMINNRMGHAQQEAASKLEVQQAQRNMGMAAGLVDTKIAGSVSYSSFAETLNRGLNTKTAGAFFMAVEVWNIKSFNASVDTLRNERGDIRVAGGILSLLADTTNTSLFLLERTGFNKNGAITNFFDQKAAGRLTRGLLMRAGIILTVTLSLSDAYYEMTEGHMGRMALNIAVAAGAAAMYFSGSAAAGTVLFGMGPVGWLGLAVLIGATAALVLCQTSDLEDWFQQGPFADMDAVIAPSVKSHLIFSEEAYYRFISLLAGIHVKLEKNEGVRRITEGSSELPEEIQRKINQANVKITLASNIPGLVNMKATKEDTKIHFQPTNNPGWFTPDIAVPFTQLYEEETANGRVIYLRIQNDIIDSLKAGKTSLKVWVQVKAELAYFDTKQTRYFPAPAPSEDILWSEAKYSKPDFTQDTMAFWHTQTFENIL